MQKSKTWKLICLTHTKYTNPKIPKQDWKHNDKLANVLVIDITVSILKIKWTHKSKVC